MIWGEGEMDPVGWGGGGIDVFEEVVGGSNGKLGIEVFEKVVRGGGEGIELEHRVVWCLPLHFRQRNFDWELEDL